MRLGPVALALLAALPAHAQSPPTGEDPIAIAGAFSWPAAPEPATAALIALGVVWILVMGLAARIRTRGDD